MIPREEVDAASAAIMREMVTRLGEVTHAVQRELLAEIPELRGDTSLIELLRDSVEGNIGTIFAAIAHAIPPDSVTPPIAAFEYARRLAQHDVSPNALVRAYRLGQQELLRLILAEIRARDTDPVLALEIFESVNISASRYIDWISEQVVGVYQTERDRWRESRDRILAQRVRDILAGERPMATGELSEAIRYPLERNHLALVLWFPETAVPRSELTGMEEFVGAVADHLGASGRPLFVANDRVTAWAWIPLYDRMTAAAADSVTAFARTYPDPPSVAIGEPRKGIDGFRRSHRMAEQARAVALRARGSERTTLSSGESGVIVAAMLDGDLADAGPWIREVLGDLAEPTESDENLRDTLRVFLECGASFKDAALRLHLHSNTVKYRIRRAEERRGRPLDEGRLDVEIALLMCARFPDLVSMPVQQ